MAAARSAVLAVRKRAKSEGERTSRSCEGCLVRLIVTRRMNFVRAKSLLALVPPISFTLEKSALLGLSFGLVKRALRYLVPVVSVSNPDFKVLVTLAVI